MENWDEHNFNSEWRAALQDAEATPSEQVWKNIDTRLMMGENATMKKRVVFYQRLAAVSVGILFLVSGYAFWVTDTDSNENSIAENSQVKTATEKSTKDGNNLQSNSIAETKQMDGSTVEPVTSNSGNEWQPVLTENNHKQGQSISKYDVVGNSSNEIIEEKATSEAGGNQPALVVAIPSNERLAFQFSADKLNPELPKKVKPNDLSIAYRIADARPAIRSKKRKELPEESTWAALGFAAGSFSQNASSLELMRANADQSTGFNNLQNSSNSTKREKTRPGSSFSWSLTGGKRVAKRWLLQGGLNYMNQMAQSSTSGVGITSANNIQDERLTSAFAPEKANSVTYTTTSEINSTFQFISIPVQAGYMLVDQKLGVQLNGGISPDVFLKSVVSDKASGTETVNTTGSNSTFKTLSISGLGGVEVSYRFAEHYRVSLVPGFRYSLTAVYKENSLASSKPFTADIGLRFRYVF